MAIGLGDGCIGLGFWVWFFGFGFDWATFGGGLGALVVFWCWFLVGVVVFGCRVGFIALGLGSTTMVSGLLAYGGLVGFRFGVGLM